MLVSIYFRAQGLDARKRLAFHPLEEGPARRGHIGELAGDAGVVQRRDGVAAAGDRLELALAGEEADRLGDGEGRRLERRRLEGAERAVPHQRLDLAERLLDRHDRLRPDVEDHLVVCDVIDVDHPRVGMRLELLGDGRVDRQDDAALGPVGVRQDLARRVGHVLLAQRLADGLALREQEGVGHAAADDQDVDLVDQVAEQLELGGDLRAADDGRDRTLRIAERDRERLELRLHGAAGKGRQLVGDALGRGVGAVGGGEGVVDVEVAELGEAFDDRRVVLFLALVEAGVLEQQDVAVLHFGDGGGGDVADAVGRKADRTADDLGDGGGDGTQRILLVRAALGTAEMREQDHLAALVGDLGDGRGDALDARLVGDLAVLGGNVEVDAQEHALAGDVGVVERAEWFGHDRSPSKWNSLGSIRPSAAAGAEAPAARRFSGLRALLRQMVLASATAVSAMRFEKPHSLSYQLRMRTKVPSMTLVWSKWKIDERGSWLKSIETLGLSV